MEGLWVPDDDILIISYKTMLYKQSFTNEKSTKLRRDGKAGVDLGRARVGGDGMRVNIIKIHCITFPKNHKLVR